MRRRLLLGLPVLLLAAGPPASAALSSADDQGRIIDPCPEATEAGGLSVRGEAFRFSFGLGRIPGAVVRAVGHPERCAVTDEQGSFALGGFAPGEAVTLTLEKEGYAPTQTGTLEILADGLARVSFQAPTWEVYHLIAGITHISPSPAKCQIASTVTEVGRSLYDDVPSHGEAGATVTLDPMPEGVLGPIYFRYLAPGLIVPDRGLAETTRDGGVLFLEAPPGEYTLTAHKEGARFTPVKVECRAGWLVNASPPWGIQTLP